MSDRSDWTFLVMREGESQVRQISVPARWVTTLAVVGGVFTSVVFGLALFLVVHGTSRIESARLAEENEVLEAELGQLRGKVSSLEGSLDQLSERDAQFRVLAGLDKFDQEVLQVGVGGPGGRTPEDLPLFELDPDVGKEAFAVRYDLDVLERRARLLTESLAEATDSLRAHRDLLESRPSILPTAGLLSSRFSPSRYHPIHHTPLPHEGVDIAAEAGTPILAAAKGVVTFAGRRAGYGLMVEIDHGYGYTTLYGHSSKLLVQRGQEVSRGDVIAQVGRSGIATSPHLHYEVRVGGRPQNPLNYVVSGAIP